jgi:LytS/YehU family sensor histidine kinase
MIALAVGMRYIIRWYEERKKLEEERRRNAEAELNWLKNQLNPHFLFNTLNNISSLVQIDADKAQGSIAQLSDLLRYALYETNNQKVKVVDEVTFMGNYIALMSLRCSEKTVVDVHFDEFDPSLRISPLLFISLVENAFKHGTSAHHDAFVKIDMGIDGPDLVFSCENSLIPKETKDYSGSGVGIENLRRRLELLYQGDYSYESFVEHGRYVAVVRIKNVGCHE